ncbi:MAG: elongation factor P [bacterium JZ-2024 1]
MAKISTNDLRSGMVVMLDGVYYLVLEASHYKPGKGQAFVRTRLKDMKTGMTVDKNLKADEDIERPFFERKPGTFLYRAGSSFHFMDNETYEEVVLNDEVVGDASRFLKENSEVFFLSVEHQILGIELPTFIELKVVEAPPGVKGDTVSGGNKLVTLETGAQIRVPLFIKEGDVIQVDTRTGEYVRRI